MSYIAHRLKRLPDSADKIARGVGVGVFVSFTPFFGMHFLVAALLALLFRGNIIAALLATFFGNPLTFPFIATGSMTLGHWILGGAATPGEHKTIFFLFKYAGADFWHNFKALFTSEEADWSALGEFFWGVYLPYLVGGLLPGLILGVAGYVLSRPLISAYKKRRKGRLLSRWQERRVKTPKNTDADT